MAEKNLEEMREAVEAIREKMAAAAREAGRDPAEVQLCAACKTRTADTVAASAALAIDVFGENHVQELCANYDAGAYCGKPSHFIGHLQTNKIKKVLGRASLIQSVDSEHLLAAIEKEAAKAGIVQDVLLEVNIGGEESKSGVSPEQLWPLLDAAAAEEHIRVKGLMAIPPVNDDDAQNRRYLAQVYKLFTQAGERGYQNHRGRFRHGCRHCPHPRRAGTGRSAARTVCALVHGTHSGRPRPLLLSQPAGGGSDRRPRWSDIVTGGLHDRSHRSHCRSARRLGGLPPRRLG